MLTENKLLLLLLMQTEFFGKSRWRIVNAIAEMEKAAAIDPEIMWPIKHFYITCTVAIKMHINL